MRLATVREAFVVESPGGVVLPSLVELAERGGPDILVELRKETRYCTVHVHDKPAVAERRVLGGAWDCGQLEGER